MKVTHKHQTTLGLRAPQGCTNMYQATRISIVLWLLFTLEHAYCCNTCKDFNVWFGITEKLNADISIVSCMPQWKATGFLQLYGQKGKQLMFRMNIFLGMRTAIKTCVSGRQRWLYVDLPQGEIAGPLCRMKGNYISDAIQPWKAVLQKFLWQSECKELTMSECKQCVI